jgi:HEAT repeat protein
MTAMIADTEEPGRESDPVLVILPHLAAPEDTIRCAAAKALSQHRNEHNADVLADALVDALLDEDADVRSDAMDALVSCARTEDAGAILQSLEGDPVKEVKIAAIAALTRLGAHEALPLIGALATGKCEDQVAWEDDDGLWDDWLDVQLEAIAALGLLEGAEYIDALLAARTDEMGQDIDHPVFAALAGMSQKGILTLLDIVSENEGRLRSRALGALQGASEELVRPLAPALAEDAASDVRLIAIPLLDHDSEVVETLVCTDPDPVVRREAIRTFADLRPDLCEAALSDQDEGVRALALDALALPDDAEALAALQDNVTLWLGFAGPRLATACVAMLGRLGAGLDVIDDHAADAELPVEARIRAVGLLTTCAQDGVADRLADHSMDSVQQIRVAAFAALGARAKADDARASELICEAILTSVDLKSDSAVEEIAEEDETSSASRVEEAPALLHISPDGEVVERGAEAADHDGQASASISDESDVPLEESTSEDDPLDGENSNVIPFPTSTLEAMGARRPEPPQIDDGADTTDSGTAGSDIESETEEEDSPARMKPRRKRVAIDGPSDASADRPRLAMRVGACLPGDAIETALVQAATSQLPGMRVAALSALAARVPHHAVSPELEAVLLASVEDEDPQVRGFAAMALRDGSLFHETVRNALIAHLDDEDAGVRAVAASIVGAADCEAALACIGDPSPIVRSAALEAIIGHQDPELTMEGFDRLLAVFAADTLRDAISSHVVLRDLALDRLSDEDADRRHVLLILSALNLD